MNHNTLATLKQVSTATLCTCLFKRGLRNARRWKTARPAQ
jgi:hypothetical protein